jgi:DNA-binding ferritin-like protein
MSIAVSELDFSQATDGRIEKQIRQAEKWLEEEGDPVGATYRMQDVILQQRRKLWMLQCEKAKRAGEAPPKMPKELNDATSQSVRVDQMESSILEMREEMTEMKAIVGEIKKVLGTLLDDEKKRSARRA